MSTYLHSGVFWSTELHSGLQLYVVCSELVHSDLCFLFHVGAFMFPVLFVHVGESGLCVSVGAFSFMFFGSTSCTQGHSGLHCGLYTLVRFYVHVNAFLVGAFRFLILFVHVATHSCFWFPVVAFGFMFFPPRWYIQLYAFWFHVGAFRFIF